MAGAGLHIEVKVEDAELRAKLAQLIAKVSHPGPGGDRRGAVGEHAPALRDRAR
jgi:hypothetical protein